MLAFLAIVAGIEQKIKKIHSARQNDVVRQNGDILGVILF